MGTTYAPVIEKYLTGFDNDGIHERIARDIDDFVSGTGLPSTKKIVDTYDSVRTASNKSYDYGVTVTGDSTYTRMDTREDGTYIVEVDGSMLSLIHIHQDGTVTTDWDTPSAIRSILIDTFSGSDVHQVRTHPVAA